MNEVDIVAIGAAQSDLAISHARINTGLRHVVFGAGDEVGGGCPTGPRSPMPGSWPSRTTPNLRSMPVPSQGPPRSASSRALTTPTGADHVEPPSSTRRTDLIAV